MATTDKKLLSRYPLAWNTRMLWMLVAGLSFNLLFYFSGLSEYIPLTGLAYTRLSMSFPLLQFSVLLTAVIIILWLTYYLRNNAFKSFYPLKRGYLFTEFLIILLCIFINSCFPFLYQAGNYQKVRNVSREIDVIREAETVNLAAHFLPYNIESFYDYNNCDSIRKRGDRSLYDENGNMINRSNVHRYSHYCGQYVYLDHSLDGPDKFALHDRAKSWIMNRQEDSIRWILNEAVRLTKKYGGKASLNIDAQVADCIRDTVTREIGTYLDSDYPGRDFIDLYKVSSALQVVDEGRYGFLEYRNFVGYFYFVLFAAVLLFSFRLTRLRTWFTGLIALGVLLILFGLFGAGGMPGDMLFILYLFLWALCLFVSWVNTGRQVGDKRVSGIGLLWFLWALPSVVPAVFNFVYGKTAGIYDNGRDAIAVNGEAPLDDEFLYENPVHVWIRQHWDLINTMNFIFTILVIAIIVIPLARRWQAAPEE